MPDGWRILGNDEQRPPISPPSSGASQRKESLLRELLTKEPLTCDFCGSGGPAWLYPGKNTTKVRMLLGADESTIGGDWMACNRCFEFIESGLTEELVDEAHTKFITENPAFTSLKDKTSDDELKDCVTIIREQIRLTHEAFLENRLGRARPI